MTAGNVTDLNRTACAQATLCPLCGQPNLCAMEIQKATGQVQPPCWCTQAGFSAELLARVPEALRRQACICAGCARPSA